jgi:hypothetical protein
MRKKMIEAQAKESPDLLEEQMNLVLQIRGTWQDLENRATRALQEPPKPGVQSYPGASPSDEEGHHISSWSA